MDVYFVECNLAECNLAGCNLVRYFALDIVSVLQMV